MSRYRCSGVLMEAVEPRRLFAIAQALQEVIPAGVDPIQIENFGNKVLFIGITQAAGQEVWVSDGTKWGTHLLRDFAPGPDDSDPGLYQQIGNEFYFAAADKLWQTDGTDTGTVAIDDFHGSASAVSIAQINDHLIYTLVTQELPLHNLLFDNAIYSVAGGNHTPLVEHLSFGQDVSASPRIGSSLYFSSNPVSGFSTSATIWRTDGTTAGTAPLKYTFANIGSQMIAYGNTLFFDAQLGADSGLWSIRPTATGKKAKPVFLQLFSSVNLLGASNGSVWFFAKNPKKYAVDELWRVNTATGNIELMSAFKSEAALDPGFASASTTGLTFVADGNQLWSVHDTDVKAHLVYAFPAPSPAKKHPGAPLIHSYTQTPNGSLYIQVVDGVRGRIWVTNVNSLAQAPTALALMNTDETLDNLGNDVAFGSFDSNGMRQLFVASSNPASVPTQLTSPTALESIGGVQFAVQLPKGLVFVGNQSEHLEVWLDADGGPGATLLASEMRLDDDDTIGAVAVTDYFVNPSSHVLYFAVINSEDGDPDHEYELWRSDGTAGGTMRIQSGLGPIKFLGSIGSDVIFDVSQSDLDLSGTIYSTDGTSAGTKSLLNIANAEARNIDASTAIGGRVYFATQARLWATDGTTSGTVDQTSRLKILTGYGDAGAFNLSTSGDGKSLIVGGDLYTEPAKDVSEDDLETGGSAALWSLSPTGSTAGVPIAYGFTGDRLVTMTMSSDNGAWLITTPYDGQLYHVSTTASLTTPTRIDLGFNWMPDQIAGFIGGRVVVDYELRDTEKPALVLLNSAGKGTAYTKLNYIPPGQVLDEGTVAYIGDGRGAAWKIQNGAVTPVAQLDGSEPLSPMSGSFIYMDSRLFFIAQDAKADSPDYSLQLFGYS